MKKQELLAELESTFTQTKEELQFEPTFEEIDKAFFIKDMILTQKYVSPRFSRQLSNRMADSSYGWISELYSLIQPPQMNFIVATEQKTLSQDEKNEIVKLIDQIMYFVRKNKRIGFQRPSKKEEGEFITEIYAFHTKIFEPAMEKYLHSFEKVWKAELEKEIIKE